MGGLPSRGEGESGTNENVEARLQNLWSVLLDSDVPKRCIFLVKCKKFEFKRRLKPRAPSMLKFLNTCLQSRPVLLAGGTLARDSLCHAKVRVTERTDG